ncbi:hypothetical protein [Candidatus Enterococcus leclercqii]|uniref:hypothetical protein n=1 Tax=Candidatus Enterococcus leclercqii TaxID=1857218 RepID=UPI001379436E|nr:hypothetical protein [Enterococcus sp. CU9D]KAF1294229.1 hypothetical protein BAU14_07525 [Enterococcus sp. CU9D]
MMKCYQEMKYQLKSLRVGATHVTKKEYGLITEARETACWDRVFETTLYQKYGSEYCTGLMIIE